ncbi:9970_t:CDS:2, partial [Funneliformis mosseae]
MSGKVPYLKEKDKSIKQIMINIKLGLREYRMIGAPDKYVELYESCWNKNSSINEVSILVKLNYESSEFSEPSFNTSSKLDEVADIIEPEVSTARKLTAAIGEITIVKVPFKTFSELCREFDSWINLLSFTILIKEKIRVEDEAEQLKSDQDDLNKYMLEMGVNVKEIGTDKEEISLMVLKINAMNNKMEKLLDEQNKKSNKLEFTDYKETNEQRNDGRITRYLDIKNEAREFAFKNISD